MIIALIVFGIILILGAVGLAYGTFFSPFAGKFKLSDYIFEIGALLLGIGLLMMGIFLGKNKFTNIEEEEENKVK